MTARKPKTTRAKKPAKAMKPVLLWAVVDRRGVIDTCSIDHSREWVKTSLYDDGDRRVRVRITEVVKGEARHV